MKKNIAAFFDIDGTIYRNSLMIENFKKLVKYEIIDPEIWYGKIRHLYNRWQRRYLEFDVYLEELAGIYLEELKGIDKSYIEFIADQVISLNGDKIYKYSRDRIEFHKKQGHLIFFISGSPDFLASEMAKKYNATEYRASIYEVDDENKFTGKFTEMWDSKSKLKAMGELIEKYNIDLENSYAYGDTAGDYSMFVMVGKPIAINPNRELLDNIKNEKNLSEKVTVIVERKNVIYKLNADVDII